MTKPIEVGWVQFYMILKTIVTLSHESASVKYGFNANKMNEESIIAQSLVKDSQKPSSWLETVFVKWLTTKIVYALFPVGIIVRDSHHFKSPTRRE